MAPVKRRDLGDPESLGNGDDSSVRRTERKSA
jgi:hypothetical protein